MTEGLRLFARFAYPPNALGYCGPADTTLACELTRDALAVDEFRHWAADFAGAWPYLESLAGTFKADPLDRVVVEAYWLGDPRLGDVDTLPWGNSIQDRFRHRAGPGWKAIDAAVNLGGVPNHAFHVFCVYPWVGLLRSGSAAPALRVLDQCRIRWGTVEARIGRELVVRSQPLAWDGRFLSLAPPRTELVELPIDPDFRAPDPGQVVAMHWNRVCETLTQNQLTRLRHCHDRHLAIVNAGPTPQVMA